MWLLLIAVGFNAFLNKAKLFKDNLWNKLTVIMGKEARTDELCAETDLRGTFLPQKTNTINAIS